MDYNNSSTANGKNERRRASFQCFDDSRFMSLPRVNHFKFYDYANLDADALREAMVSFATSVLNIVLQINRIENMQRNQYKQN